ncbi:MAG: amino acid ABC transporter permease [Lachnospiraceae bacterium]|nr:amino acid ABC transporter permease [Lachnospiraceae bacterium]
MDAEVLRSYLPGYAEAFFLTIRIGWIGIALSFGIGILTAFVSYYKVPVLKRIAGVYVELFRNTPLLVQLFFIYFGLPKIGFSLSAEACGIIGLGLLGGSYMSESFRSGLDAISKVQTESALALGMTNFQVFWLIVFPEALSLSVPAIVANVIFLLKETSVFSAISLMDLMFTAKDLIGLYYNTTEALFLLVLFYILMLLPVSLIGSIAEKRARYKMLGV